MSAEGTIVSPWIAPGWHLAICVGCDPIAPQPFKDPVLRDIWAREHAAETGHEVAKAEGAAE